MSCAELPELFIRTIIIGGEEELSCAEVPELYIRTIIIAPLAQCPVLVFGACLQGTVEVQALLEVMSFVINCHD